MSVAGASLVSQADVPANRYEQWSALAYAYYRPDQGDIQGVLLGLGNADNSAWGYPASWNYDHRYHPVTTTTIAFDHPVKDPVIAVSDATRQAKYYEFEVAKGAALGSEQIAFTAASNGSINVPFSVELMPSFSAGYEVQGGTTVTPSLVDGQVPYESEVSHYCTGSYIGSQDPILSPLVYTAFQPGGVFEGQPNNVRYTNSLCGQMKVNTGGEYVTSVTFAVNQTFLSIRNGQLWNGNGWSAHVFNVMTQDEVSGSTTPSSYGVATHTVSDLRIGSDIVAAYTNTTIKAPVGSDASNSSGAGYTPGSQLVRATLTNRSTGTYQIAVPTRTSLRRRT